jgi:hypothetical protein|uniref:Uncharacterized protein n=1 Tax=viral metagenome TaxID=1070528 RepID=A0A6C0B6K4_9ZZZZ
MEKLFTVPSIMTHTLNGGLLLLGGILIAVNFSFIRRLPTLQLIILVLILSIAVGVHGLSHVGVESAYGYNPLKIFGF